MPWRRQPKAALPQVPRYADTPNLSLRHTRTTLCGRNTSTLYCTEPCLTMGAPHSVLNETCWHGSRHSITMTSLSLSIAAVLIRRSNCFCIFSSSRVQEASG